MKINDAGWNLENSYLKLPEIFYSRVEANKVSSPELAILNSSLLEYLGLDIDEIKSDEGINVLAGNISPNKEAFLAMAYGGHQYGRFTMLGDGRAMLIGEQITPRGERLDIQLKGSGRTPYSRRGDGRSTLGAMLREYIISEAMYKLGIPTTRSLAVVKTGDSIYRENQMIGAILTRVSESHIRVGTFEFAAKFGKVEDLKALADYTIKRHFPEIVSKENPYISLLKEVIKSQASLISKWQLIGFVHGVMNTDNMAISGQTIDYGPCAFMDIYNPKTVFSSIDRYGRYSYENQPAIGKWNLARFAETLLALIDKDVEKAISLAEEALEDFDKIYHDKWISGMRFKIGLLDEEVEDEELIKELLELMNKYKLDYTNTFIDLTYDRIGKSKVYKNEDFQEWLIKWENRLKGQKITRVQAREIMKKSNPVSIPRNHLVEEALKAAEEKEDYMKFNKLLEVLSNPYDPINIDSKYTSLPENPSQSYITYCGT